MLGIDSFDWTILKALNEWALRLPFLDSVMVEIVQLRSLAFGLMMAALWYLWFHDANRSPEVRGRIVTTILSGVGAVVIGRMLAEGLPFQTRPFSAPGQLLRPIDLSVGLRTWSSFPSDHAAMAFALSMGIWMMARWLGALAFLISLFFIALPRVFLGLHYPSDVIAGALIGIIVTSVLHADRVRARVSALIRGLERGYSGAFHATLFITMYEVMRMFDDIRRPVASFFNLLH